MAQVEATPHGLWNPSCVWISGHVQLLRLSLVSLPNTCFGYPWPRQDTLPSLVWKLWFPLQEITSALDTVATIQSSARLWDTWASPGPLC